MTTFDLDHNHAAYQIRSFKPGAIQINDTIFTKNLIITPQTIIENWEPQRVEELTAHAFHSILGLRPQILLIGTGERHIFLPIEIYGHLLNHGIGVEIMETGAACRTYNALSAEERNVVAALLLR